MKILLLGEYSNFHNSLKKGLESQGCTVVLAGRKDGFKSLPVDISLEPTFFSKNPFLFTRKVIYRLCNWDIGSVEIMYLFFKHLNKFKGFDVVQLINEYPIKSSPYLDKILLKYIFKYNKKVFVSACGNDVVYINYILNSNLNHHTLSGFVKNPKLKPHFKYSLAYLNTAHRQLSNFVSKHCEAYIPADMDYYMAYKNHPKAKSLIPFPINLDTLTYIPQNLNGPVKIFHGVNSVNYYKKGNDFFKKALLMLKEKYDDKITVIEVEDIPYSTYISLYNDSHIILDQVYAYDQGYNALEAMAKGKVVFTGVSKEFIDYYNIKKNIGVHTTPNIQDIVDNLSDLIDNPEKIIEISKNARAYVVEHHDYKKVAQQYLDCWTV